VDELHRELSGGDFDAELGVDDDNRNRVRIVAFIRERDAGTYRGSFVVVQFGRERRFVFGIGVKLRECFRAGSLV